MRMKRQRTRDELADQWVLAPREIELLANKAGATRLGFAVLLKSFMLEGRFPRQKHDVPGAVVVQQIIDHVLFQSFAEQTGQPDRPQTRGTGHLPYGYVHSVPPGDTLPQHPERAFFVSPPARASSQSPRWRFPHSSHDWYFTYAERMGRAGCDIPAMGLDWKTTRPPVMLDRWQSEPPATTWTTVMTWDTFRQPIEHEGKIYGTKELEFPKVEALPGATDARLEVATGGNRAPVERWRSLGWSVVDSFSVSRDAQAYRRYIQQSRGEFSVAKNVYVATGSGWFSCRSACYLAAGRPVVVQDTGFSEILPTGLGLLAFQTFEEARLALESVEADYEMHQQAARSLARDHLRAETVIQHLLDQIGVT